jgi:hypothetical protein
MNIGDVLPDLRGHAGVPGRAHFVPIDADADEPGRPHVLAELADLLETETPEARPRRHDRRQ